MLADDTLNAEEAASLDVVEVLKRYEEAAAQTEMPPGDLALKVARCHARLGSSDAAYHWLRRLAESTDAFLAWSGAAALRARLVRKSAPPARRRTSVALTGSYTLDQFAAMLPLAGMPFGIDIAVHTGNYGQYQQDLLDPRSGLHVFVPEHVVIAVHEGVVELPEFSDSPADAVRAEAARWSGLWRQAASRSATVIQHNFALRPETVFGNLSSRLPGSRYSMLQELNRQLGAAPGEDVTIVDCERLAANFGRERWFDERYWFRSKLAVALPALPLLARHTAAVLASHLGLQRKCLVLDLDNTLWGGVIGEDGLAGIVLGSDGNGEAFRAFQDYILALKDRGIVLAVASKNNEADAREVFEQHPDMRLRLDDISVFAVNWEDKPANLRRIAKTLNIGLDSLVLVDDNPAERQVVRRLLPDVDVVALPTDPSRYRRALSEYLGFEPVAVTSEDRGRAAQYRAGAVVAELASSAADLGSFLRDLRMEAVIAPFDDLHLPRIHQLCGKTNQFNLTTRRHGPAELQAFMRNPRYVTRYLKLRDRLADHGLIALMIGEITEDAVDIETFLMSCRVIGRTVERRLLAEAAAIARAHGRPSLRGTYIPTAKNELVRDLYERFGFSLVQEDSSGTMVWEYDVTVQGPIENHYIKDAHDALDT